jgi:hypothetical protein
MTTFCFGVNASLGSFAGMQLSEFPLLVSKLPMLYCSFRTKFKGASG